MTTPLSKQNSLGRLRLARRARERTRVLTRYMCALLLFSPFTGCGARIDPTSTDTGNPPWIDRSLFRVTAGEAPNRVQVSGEPGAVPAETLLKVTNVSTEESVEITSDSTGGFTIQMEGTLEDEFLVHVGAETIPVQVASTPVGGDGSIAESSSAPPTDPTQQSVIEQGEELLVCSDGEPDASGRPIPMIPYLEEEGRYPPLPLSHPDLRCAAFENEAQCRIEAEFALLGNSCSDATDCDALLVPPMCAFNDCQLALPVAARNLQHLEDFISKVNTEVCGPATDQGCEFPSAPCPGIGLTVECIENQCTAVYVDGTPTRGQ